MQSGIGWETFAMTRNWLETILARALRGGSASRNGYWLLVYLMMAVTSVPAAAGPELPADAAADYVAERIRDRMEGEHGWMMTSDFVFDYYEDAVAGQEKCMIRMPRLYGTLSSMPRVLGITGGRRFLVVDEAMLTVVLTPESVQLWIPDPSGEGPGIRIKASSSTDHVEIGRDQWTHLGNESGYLVADSDVTLTLLAALYSGDAVHVNPKASPVELQSYETSGYFTAMDTARRLCPDNLPPQLLRFDVNPRANEPVFNALEPGENDRIVDLRGRGFPIDTPYGELDIIRDSKEGSLRLTFRGQPAGIRNTVVEPQALINLSGASYALVLHACTVCGNAPDAGNLLELLRLDADPPYRTYPLDEAYIWSRSLVRMTLSLEDRALTINIPDVGVYRFRHDDSNPLIDYEAAPVDAELARIEKEGETLRDESIDGTQERAASRWGIIGDNEQLAESDVLVSYVLAGNTWQCRTRNPDGTETSDSYRFNNDGTFESVSGNTRVSGLFERSGTELRLTFSRIIRRGRSRIVNARTTASIERLDSRELVFTTLDARTSELRRVSCRG